MFFIINILKYIVSKHSLLLQLGAGLVSDRHHRWKDVILYDWIVKAALPIKNTIILCRCNILIKSNCKTQWRNE